MVLEAQVKYYMKQSATFGAQGDVDISKEGTEGLPVPLLSQLGY